MLSMGLVLYNIVCSGYYGGLFFFQDGCSVEYDWFVDGFVCGLVFVLVIVYVYLVEGCVVVVVGGCSCVVVYCCCFLGYYGVVGNFEIGYCYVGYWFYGGVVVGVVDVGDGCGFVCVLFVVLVMCGSCIVYVVFVVGGWCVGFVGQWVWCQLGYGGV